MTNIQVNPLVLKDMLMQLGDDNYETAISSAVFTPTAPTVSWQGGTPESSFTDVGAATWVGALTYAQDWDTPGSLSRTLYEKEGQTLPASFRPKKGVGASFTVPLIITPGSIGGTVNTFNESTVNLGCKGKPVLLPAAAAAPVMTAASPANGPAAGGTIVKLTGSGFTGATGVKFGAVAATQFLVDSDRVIYAVAPAQAAGAKAATVTNATGVSANTAPYTYA